MQGSGLLDEMGDIHSPCRPSLFRLVNVILSKFQMICGSARGIYCSIFLSFRRKFVDSRYFLHIIIVGPKESLFAELTCTWTSGGSAKWGKYM